MIAGAVIGALLGCVLILLLVWFIAHTVKKHKYKEVKVSEANEMKLDFYFYFFNAVAFHQFIPSSSVTHQLSLCPLGGALLRPRKPQRVFPWQPQLAASMLRQKSNKPKKKKKKGGG